MTYLCAEEIKKSFQDVLAEYLCVCVSLGKILTQCEQKIRKIHSFKFIQKKNAVIGLGLKCPVVLVTGEKVPGQTEVPLGLKGDFVYAGFMF